MSYPKPKIVNSEIDLKLGIKSSLPNATQAIVLLYLIWKCEDKKSQIAYSKQNGDGLLLKDELSAKISDLLQNNVEQFNKSVFDNHILNNPLLKAQIEALIVGFELVWKLARFQFADGSSFSAERTGGKRFEKIISYTSNIDVFDLLVQSNEKDFLQFFYEVLTEAGISNKVVFDSFRKLFTVFSETAIYKIKSDNGDLIFDNFGIYKSLLENSVVNLSGTEENKGSSRILKSSISEGLNYYVTVGNDGYVKDDSHSDDLSSYSERVKNFLSLTQIKVSFEDKNEIETKIENETNISPAATTFTSLEQIIYYGVPGSGKSHKINEKTKNIPNECKIRVVFHPEYSNADFVGQILPQNEAGSVEYKFRAGAFSEILLRALQHQDEPHCLIIEEINRGNAAAIFGDLFQLLDRDEDGWSEYPVQNPDIIRYLRDNGIAEEYIKEGVKLPPNLSLYATMNTSDQNVFTLDNAFQRRWDMRLVENKFDDSGDNQENATIEGTNVTWGEFQREINAQISQVAKKQGLSSMEDKRLGCYFVKAKDGKITKEDFSQKVLKYLWDDAFKFDRESVFKSDISNLEELVFKFEKESGGLEATFEIKFEKADER